MRHMNFKIIILLLLIPTLLWAWSRKPPEPPSPTDFPLYGGVAGQFHKHPALTLELNEDLNWQIVRWSISSWVIDSIGWLEFRDSLLHRLNPPNVKILLQLRWNSPDFIPKPASMNQHCIPDTTFKGIGWAKWWAFCYQMADLFKDDNVWFQIGNEPDMSRHKYWSGTIPEFIFYVNFAADAIKDANPDAYVVCGGFTGGRGIKPVMEQIVAGLDVNVDALDRHYYLDNAPEADLDKYMRVWPDYCHKRGFDCFVTELSPPRFDKVKEAGVDCAMFFDLWGTAGGTYAAANENGTATEMGKELGRWIEKNIHKKKGN